MGDRAERRQRPGRDAAEGRLEPDDAAEARRDADRAAAVGADMQRAHAERRGHAAPPLDPPDVRARFQGLRATWPSGLSVTPFQPNSGVVVLPEQDRARLAQPRRRRRVLGRRRRIAGGRMAAPAHVQPRVSTRSLIVVGTPSRRPARLALQPTRLGRARGRQAPSASTEAEGADQRRSSARSAPGRPGHLDRRQRAPAVMPASARTALRTAGSCAEHGPGPRPDRA